MDEYPLPCLFVLLLLLSLLSQHGGAGLKQWSGSDASPPLKKKSAHQEGNQESRIIPAGGASSSR
jgi:hypothetical protein